MAKIKVYKCIEDFKIVINEKITIEKGQLIPEDFFIKNFASPKKQIEILLNLKKIKLNDGKDIIDDNDPKALELVDMTKKQLVAHAEENGIVLENPKAKNEEIIIEIETALEDKKDEGGEE